MWLPLSQFAVTEWAWDQWFRYPLNIDLRTYMILDLKVGPCIRKSVTRISDFWKIFFAEL